MSCSITNQYLYRYIMFDSIYSILLWYKVRFNIIYLYGSSFIHLLFLFIFPSSRFFEIKSAPKIYGSLL